MPISKAALCLVTFWLCSASAFANDKPKLPEGTGRATTQRLCGTCHAAEVVMSRRESREGWSGIVQDMVDRGLKGTDEEFGDVVDYLVANFPPGAPVAKVNVNRAEAADLVAGVGFTAAQASAIVKFRKEKGDYKSVEDLQNVPGLKANVIEAKKSRLEF